jgi:IS5 family transposase
VPQQRNSRDENKQIKEGEVPEEWEKNLHKKAQKDTDAHRTKKGDETHYGYKDHVKIDADSKMIPDYAVTPTNVHDSNEFEDFFNEQDEAGYADSAYAGKKLPEYVRNEVCEKGYRNKPLIEEQKGNNC